jgi:hypothetical protein
VQEREALSLTVSVDPATGRVSLTGPLNDRETCLKLLAEGFRLVLTMKPGAAPPHGIQVPPPDLVPHLGRPAPLTTDH